MENGQEQCAALDVLTLAVLSIVGLVIVALDAESGTGSLINSSG